jgi:hypothetical protein
MGFKINKYRFYQKKKKIIAFDTFDLEQDATIKILHNRDDGFIVDIKSCSRYSI